MYKYDLFVSYKREPGDSQLITPWLYKILAIIEYWLRQELKGQSGGLFVDTKSIEPGDEWPDAIRHALLTSKCLLPIWSPEYFRSAWCMAEWRSFLLREKIMADQGKPGCRLIIPITLHDGKWFPPEAARIQQFNLSQFAATTDGFWGTRRADELDQMLMRQVAPALAKAVRQAPQFQADWPVDVADPMPPPSDVELIRL